MKRREFIKSSAMTAAAAAAAGHVGVAAAADNKAALEGLKWDKAPCRFCGTGCTTQVGVKDGKVVAVRGDEKAEVNKGLLCVKGYHVGLALYGKDRLTKPLLKKNGKHVEISWEEAIQTVADRIKGNSAGFAIYGSGQWTIPEGYANQKFIKGGLSNNHIDPNARLCMASAVTGFLGAYGVDEPASCYDDLDQCDVFITWGNNPAEMHPILFSRVVDRRSRGKQVKIIDMQTRFTRTAELADKHILFKPHSDLAIANGIAHLLIKNGTYDKEFVEKFVNFRHHEDQAKPSLFGQPTTFEDYKTSLEKYTPEYVEKISGVSVDDIKMLAGLFGNKRLKITSVWCMGVNQHTRGTAMNHLIHGVHLLSGHWGRPGDGPQSLTGQPSACGTAREVGTLAHALPGGRIVAKEAHRKGAEKLWNLPEGRINAKPGYHTVKMWEQFTKATAEGGDIHTIWVQVTNPGHTLPNLERLFTSKEGLEDKFLIVSEVYPTATTKLADLILPSAMWVEKNGIFGNSERRTQQWFKMVEPPGDARDDVWQVIAVAKKLHDMGVEGMKDKDGNFIFGYKNDQGEAVPIWDWSKYYSMNVDKALYEEYRPFSRLKHKDLAPYEELVKARGLRWPVVEQPDGSWRETRWRFAESDDPYAKKGSKFDFYHSTTKDGKAQIWFHPYVDPPEMPDEQYPMWLCTGRVVEHWHSGTMTMRVDALRRAMPHAYVEVNPEDARDKGINNGDKVKLTTRRGTIVLRAWIDGRGKPPKGSLFVPFFDERLLINELTLHLHDPISKQPDYKKCAVRLEPAGKEEGMGG